MLNSLPNKSIEGQQKDLLRITERLSALQQDPPTLLSRRFLKGACSEFFEQFCGKCEFCASCFLEIAEVLYEKVISLGTCVSSLSFEERCSGVQPPNIGFIKETESQTAFENRDLSEVWAEIFPSGVTLEYRGSMHRVAVKAAMDEHGKKYLVVHDPIQGKSEILWVPQNA
jgi:hypothetical protein